MSFVDKSAFTSLDEPPPVVPGPTPEQLAQMKVELDQMTESISKIKQWLEI